MLKNYLGVLVQRLKDLALSLQWLGSLLWCTVYLWPGTFICCEQGQKKKKKLCLEPYSICLELVIPPGDFLKQMQFL